MMEILLWLFVINLGIAFGAGLYESRTTVPQWLSFRASPDIVGMPKPPDTLTLA